MRRVVIGLTFAASAILSLPAIAQPKANIFVATGPTIGRVLPDRRRNRGRSHQERAGSQRNRRSNRRLDGEPAADPAGAGRYRFVDGGCGLGCVQGPGQVQGPAGPGARLDGALSQSHAHRDRRGYRHQQSGGPQGQARVDRSAQQRDPDHGVPRARGGMASIPRRTSFASGWTPANRPRRSRTRSSMPSSGWAACRPPR